MINTSGPKEINKTWVASQTGGASKSGFLVIVVDKVAKVVLVDI